MHICNTMKKHYACVGSVTDISEESGIGGPNTLNLLQRVLIDRLAEEGRIQQKNQIFLISLQIIHYVISKCFTKN